MVCQELLSSYTREHADEVSESAIFERFNQSQEVKQLTLTWFMDAQKMRDCLYPHCFDAFPTLWRALNGWAECITNQERDRRWLDALILNQRMQETFIQLLERDDQFSVAANSFMAQWPIFKSSAIHHRGIPWAKGNRPEIVAYYLENEIPFEPRCWNYHEDNSEKVPLDWPHTLTTMYRVRNNIIHGVKAKNDANHQIVSSAFHVLLLLLEKGAFLG
jgi:hypothetical protein